jgi:uncharacterized protein YabE (DUF348 family)
MLKKYSNLLSAGMLFAGLFLLALSARRQVTLIVDGQPQIIHTWALTTGQALRSAGFELHPFDRLHPDEKQWLGWNPIIKLDRSSQVTILASSDGLPRSFQSSERFPGNLAQMALLLIFPGDQLIWNGRPVPLDSPLPVAPTYTLQLKQSIPITLTEGEQTRTLYTSAGTLRQALWQAGIRLGQADTLSLSPETPLNIPVAIELRRAIPLKIKIGDQTINSQSSALTVGQALAENGISLQGLDFSQPAESQSLPANGAIRVVRVHEETQLQENSLPFKSELVADPNLEIGQQRIIAAGQPGLQVTRLRIRYEDGQEVSRITEAQWTASEPRSQKTGYGTKVAIHTLDTPDGKIEYWRAVQVYATSYSPCNSGSTRCYSGTSMGLPVKRGVIAVTSQWYRLLAGQPVYIPGYGRAIIADIGGGVPGKYWIDLGFTDSDFEAWHQDVTLYFLTPVPASVPWNLP